MLDPFTLTILEVVALIKAYLLAHGMHIASAALIAAVIAAMRGKNPAKAAMAGGAGTEAAEFIENIIHNLI